MSCRRIILADADGLERVQLPSVLKRLHTSGPFAGVLDAVTALQTMCTGLEFARMLDGIGKALPVQVVRRLEEEGALRAGKYVAE